MSSIARARIYCVQSSKLHPILLELETDDGRTGLGEAAISFGFGGPATAALLREMCERVLIGRDPARIGEIRGLLMEQSFWAKGGGAIIHAAISAIDLALWDLRARSLGVPVYDLFGGPLRDEIAVYANGWNYDYPDADGWARASERPLRDGYSFLKCYPLAMPSDTGGTLRHPGRKSASPELIALGVDRIRRLRDLAGDSVRIAIDLCAAVAPADLLRFARQIEDCGIEWLEEAGDPADPGAFTAIAAGTPIPLAAGERFFGLAGFRDLIASRAVSVLQPDLGTCGGFSEFQQIAALANSYSHKISPHNCGGAVLTAASLQMAACTANFLALETFPYFRDHPGYVGLTLFDPLDRISQGHIAVDRTPGLGVQADHAAIAPFLFAECPAPRPGNR